MAAQMAPNKKELLKRFAALFRGSQRSHGVFKPQDAHMFTRKEGHDERTFAHHLQGKTGLGVVPILDDGTCWFACIDIDCHGDDEPEIDLVEVETKVRELKLPLTVCRSKSGGAHLYLFGLEPLPASLTQHALIKWAADLGYPGVEVFPKQTRLLRDSDGELQLGNWINLPYFNARDTVRYAVEGGKQIDLEYFIELAESRRVSRDDLTKLFGTEHGEAPPCFQRMLAEGVDKGHRNEALYHAVVYLKRAFPDDWRERAMEFNEQVFKEPLEASEAKKCINSAGRREYRYKCAQEPCKSYCNREVCVTRKFGVQPSQMQDMPTISQIRKFNTDPIMYEVVADGVPVKMTADEFLSWRIHRKRLMAVLDRPLPRMKDEVWENEYLGDLMKIIETVEVPDEASTAGLVRARLMDWLRKAKEAETKEDRLALMRGIPIRTELAGDQVFMFRGRDFVDHLKRTRSEDLRGGSLWVALESLGLKHQNVRVAKSPMKVWVVPSSVTEDPDLEPEQFETEY